MSPETLSQQENPNSTQPIAGEDAKTYTAYTDRFESRGNSDKKKDSGLENTRRWRELGESETKVA